MSESQVINGLTYLPLGKTHVLKLLRFVRGVFYAPHPFTTLRFIRILYNRSKRVNRVQIRVRSESDEFFEFYTNVHDNYISEKQSSKSQNNLHSCDYNFIFSNCLVQKKKNNNNNMKNTFDII